MKNADRSLLSRAQSYLRNPLRRTALAVAPLATLGLSPTAHALSDAVFTPGEFGGTGGTDSNGIFGTSGGGVVGSALPTGSNGVTGVKYQGGISFSPEFTPEGGFAGVVGSIQMFSIDGTGSGHLDLSSGVGSVHYDFTLDVSEAFIGELKVRNPLNVAAADPARITGWKLALSVTTSAGTSIYDVTNAGGEGRYTGDVEFPLDLEGEDDTTLLSYTGVLTVDYEFDANPQGVLSISVDVPADSIDFNAVAVPEPSTWVLLATGVVGTGFRLMRVRQRSPRCKAANGAA